jgi:TonB family protein
MKSTVCLAAALSVLLLSASALHAQEPLQIAKDLYASAAYEDALRVLAGVHAESTQAEVARYRTFCLIALGRTNEAERAIETVVAHEPLYVPQPAEVAPRIRELFVRTRQQLMPAIARRMYKDGRDAFARRDMTAAAAAFEEMIRVIDSVGAAKDASVELDELRFLAKGFLDLTRALPEMAAPAPSTPRKANAAVAVADAAGSPLSITPPIAIRQDLPVWTPADNKSRQESFSGAIRVMISASGRVESAELVRSIHPAYDAVLLQKARSWQYHPARRGDVALPSERVVQVELKPR